MTPTFLFLLLAGAADPAVVTAPEPSADTAQLPDADLAAMRGGFTLPNGLTIALAVQTDTSVNGNLLLRSVFRAADGAPTLNVFTPDVGRAVTAAGAAMRSGQSGPRVTVTQGAAAASGVPDAGLVAIVPTDTPTPTANGEVSVRTTDVGQRVDLRGDGIDVGHLVGGAIGSIVGNTGSDRAIDTVTSVSIDLRGVTPESLGSTMFRVEALALDALRGRAN